MNTYLNGKVVYRPVFRCPLSELEVGQPYAQTVNSDAGRVYFKRRWKTGVLDRVFPHLANELRHKMVVVLEACNECD